MAEPIGSRRDAASALFNLSGYRVIAVGEEPTIGRWVDIEVSGKPFCPACGAAGSKVHSSRSQRVRDIPVAGEVTVIWRKRRWFCVTATCPKRTFSESTEQVPPYARSTMRLREALVTAVTRAGRAASEVAASFSVSWWLVQAMLTAAAALIDDVDTLVVRRVGIDEHRFRRVRYFRLPTGKWRRYEPWMSTVVDLDTGRVLGVVDGRDNKGVGAWLAARPQAWRDRIEVVAIDPSAAFAKAIAANLPHAAISVDAFHLVKLANDMVTTVRQRLSRQQKNRKLEVIITRLYETPTPADRNVGLSTSTRPHHHRHHTTRHGTDPFPQRQRDVQAANGGSRHRYQVRVLPRRMEDRGVAGAAHGAGGK
ncbi:ISL3 family transposase [Rhodococcus opacus]|uniref:ISL3 family transposase n=1 Tax=Rhodococcus opacus TaxID=37919 RepID=UPI0029542BD0|nr:ISL3 family transposase [Rhodococcus opacus]MDV7090994.1 ISL3 family transposase [Rhodococcus opacus]